MAEKTKKMKPIDTCPNGHHYNTIKYGDICKICGAKWESPDPKELTQEELEELTHIEEKNWVCGWLVCVEGPNKGRDYKIIEGKNFAGGSPAMDIYIQGDKRIEKKNHALIMYDSKQKKVMLLPTDSQGMVYCQGQAVFEPVALDPFDVVEFGECIYRYAPFCGPDFSWEDTMD